MNNFEEKLTLTLEEAVSSLPPVTKLPVLGGCATPLNTSDESEAELDELEEVKEENENMKKIYEEYEKWHLFFSKCIT